MNNSTDSGGPISSGDVGSFPYVVGISVGILFLLTTLTIASYFCTKVQVPPPPPAIRAAGHRRGEIAIDVEPGLEQQAIDGYPKMVYSEAKSESAAVSGCSICLGDYRNGDVLRLLPDCGHVFHVGCIDPWLRLNPSCPVCRASPAPSPLSTPLAEVVPLATGRS